MIRRKEILFKTLPALLNDMKKKEWIIDSFPFKYKAEQYIVILTRYKENESKPNDYAVAKVEFVLGNNINNSIIGYIDFYNVHFKSATEFCRFFGVEIGIANRDLFKDFAVIFSNFIPKEKVIVKNDVERMLIGSRAEGNNPNTIYCYDVRRNGIKEDGSPNKRSIENSNKAQSLRPELYEIYGNDTNLSFFFSDRKDRGKSNSEIMKVFAARSYR